MDYPKRGEDCEYTEDCIWGVDGWCDRPKNSKCVIEKMDDKKRCFGGAEMNTPSKCTKCLHKAVCCKAPLMLQVEEYVEKLNYCTEIEAGKVEFKTNSFESKYRQTLKKDASVSIVAVCDNYLDKGEY